MNMAKCAVLLIGVMLSVPAYAQSLLLPFAQSGYKYTVVTSFPPGAEAEVYDESNMLTGTAPFTSGNSYGCGDFYIPGTEWPVGTLLVARYHLNLSGIPIVPILYYGIDNDVRIYVNGVLVADTQHEGCARQGDFAIPVPAGLLHGGDNVIAVLATDRGVVSAFDMSIRSQCVTPALPASWAQVKAMYR